MKQFANLDILRTVAVLCVAFSHLYFFWGGPTRHVTLVHNAGVGGVVFFFVHTSLVLFYSMDRSAPCGMVRKFYIRRFFRIFPLCWACIAFVLGTGLTDAPYSQLSEKGVLINLFLVQNIVRVGSVVGPLWSLPWEVQMYVILPFLFLFIKRKNTLWIPLTLWVLSTVAAILSTSPSMPRQFHALVFIPMFIGGMVAYQASKIEPKRISGVWWILIVPAFVILRLLLLRGELIDSQWNTFINAAICLALGLAIPAFKDVKGHTVVTIAHNMAKYSYGIYLFHVPMLVLWFGLLGNLPKIIKLIAWIGSTALISYVCHHTIEKPLMHLGKMLTRDRVTALRSTPTCG